MSNSKGEPTNALYGVVNMMKKLPTQYPSDYYICVFDAKGPTFRDQLYDDYKANRPPMEDDLRFQLEQIHDLVKAMGWQVIKRSGVEADDMIASIAEHAKLQGDEVLVSTGDKDLAQLVDDKVTLVNTMTNVVFDEAGVFEKFQVKPTQIIDYLMLLGDTSDNIPGVKGVGKRTAAKWLNQYGSLDQIVANIDDIKGKVVENLRCAIPQFELTRSLVTIKRDCDLTDEMPFDRQSSIDLDYLIEAFERFEFKTFLREVHALKTSDEVCDVYGKTDVSIVSSHGKNTQETRTEAVQYDMPEVPTTKYITIKTHDELLSCIEALKQAEYIAIDTETTSVSWTEAQLVGLSLSVSYGQAWYIPVRHVMDQALLPVQEAQIDLFSVSDVVPEASKSKKIQYVHCPDQLNIQEVLSALKPILESAQYPKILHNAKYDQHIFQNEGIALSGVVHDTLLMAYVLDSSQKVNLEALSLKYLGRQGVSYKDLCGQGAHKKRIDQVSIEEVSHYACEDAEFTLGLFQVLDPLLRSDEQSLEIYQLEMQTYQILYAMERHGVYIDQEQLVFQSQDLASQIERLESQIFEIAGETFNLNSPKQLGHILYEKLNYPILSKTSSKKPSTDEGTLIKLAKDYPVAHLLLDYRSLSKLKSTYTDKLVQIMDQNTHRVHTNYAQSAVFTGRLASSDPNLQNIPIKTPLGRRVRQAFIAPKGYHLVSADYSQVELRIMAHASDDQYMQAAFLRGDDIHCITASEIFHVSLEQVTSDQRRAAKAINFGLIYGMGVYGLAQQLQCSRGEAQEYINRYFARYTQVRDYMRYITDQVKQTGEARTCFGRRLVFHKGTSRMATQAMERQAINAPIQGAAADLIKKAMLDVQLWLDREAIDATLILQVHDELVLEVSDSAIPNVCQVLPQLMSQVVSLKVPLVVDVGQGRNWLEAH